MSTDYCVVLTTYSDEEVGRKIIDGLIKERLAACIQASAISSYYHWKGAVNNDPETLLLIKTKISLYSQVESFIKSNHSYECPEIIMLPINAGFGDYLKWIEDETQ